MKNKPIEQARKEKVEECMELANALPRRWHRAFRRLLGSAFDAGVLYGIASYEDFKREALKLEFRK
jgi:hypothetical protein